MKLMEWYRKWREEQDYQSHMLSQLKARRKAIREFMAAVKANNFTMAAQIKARIESMPCPMCGKNGGFDL